MIWGGKTSSNRTVKMVTPPRDASQNDTFKAKKIEFSLHALFIFVKKCVHHAFKKVRRMHRMLVKPFSRA